MQEDSDDETPGNVNKVGDTTMENCWNLDICIFFEEQQTYEYWIFLCV